MAVAGPAAPGCVTLRSKRRGESQTPLLGISFSSHLRVTLPNCPIRETRCRELRLKSRCYLAVGCQQPRFRWLLLKLERSIMPSCCRRTLWPRPRTGFACLSAASTLGSSRLLKNSDCRLLKKTQRRASEIEHWNTGFLTHESNIPSFHCSKF
jgi:hypothetical protein